jgi:glutathione S-transferase
MMPSFTLYHFPFSLFSIIVRYAIALGGDASEDVHIEQTIIDLHRDENLSEFYLTKINPKGQVPALTSTILPEPVTGSLEIILYLANFLPNLVPEIHKSIIIELLNELHAIQPLSLSAPPLEREKQQEGNVNPKIDEYLQQDAISTSWQKALEYKKIL